MPTMPYTPLYQNKNTITTNPDSTCTLTIERRNGNRYHVQFDAVDLPMIERRTWHVLVGRCGFWYAVSGTPADRTFLHRMIDGTPAEAFCRFRDGDSFNCTRENLERVTTQQALQQHKAEHERRRHSRINNSAANVEEIVLEQTK